MATLEIILIRFLVNAFIQHVHYRCQNISHLDFIVFFKSLRGSIRNSLFYSILFLFILFYFAFSLYLLYMFSRILIKRDLLCYKFAVTVCIM